MDPTRNMHHDVTHWPITGTNGYGGFTFGTPVLVVCRWQDVAELFRDANNEEVISDAIVYMPVDVDIGDFLAQGDHTSPTVTDPTTLTSPRAYRVRQRHRTTDLRNLVALRKVFL